MSNHTVSRVASGEYCAYIIPRADLGRVLGLVRWSIDFGVHAQSNETAAIVSGTVMTATDWFAVLARIVEPTWPTDVIEGNTDPHGVISQCRLRNDFYPTAHFIGGDGFQLALTDDGGSDEQQECG